MLPQILPGADRLVTKATQSSQPVRNREWKASTDVGRVCTAWQQELADLAWLLIEVGLDEALVVDPNVDVQEVDTPCLEIVVEGELDRGMEGPRGFKLNMVVLKIQSAKPYFGGEHKFWYPNIKKLLILAHHSQLEVKAN